MRSLFLILFLIGTGVGLGVSLGSKSPDRDPLMPVSLALMVVAAGGLMFHGDEGEEGA